MRRLLLRKKSINQEENQDHQEAAEVAVKGVNTGQEVEKVVSLSQEEVVRDVVEEVDHPLRDRRRRRNNTKSVKTAVIEAVVVTEVAKEAAVEAEEAVAPDLPRK